jgi:hypothetical protein
MTNSPKLQAPALNLSLWNDLERKLGTTNLIDWLEMEAERIANLGRTHRGTTAFSSSLLRDRRIVMLRSKPFLPGLQTIVATSRGYEVNYSPFQRIEDQRFGIAHEIAHTFWFVKGEFGVPLSSLQRSIGEDKTIEWLCNRAAAALLLPRSQLEYALRQFPAILHLIPEISRTYLVPERLVGRRLFHDLTDTNFSIVAVDGSVRDNAHVSWFAAPPNMKALKRDLNRVIPFDLLPNIPSGTSSEVEVDGRWSALVRSVFDKARAKPLARQSSVSAVAAHVGRVQDRWFIAIATGHENL